MKVKDVLQLAILSRIILGRIYREPEENSAQKLPAEELNSRLLKEGNFRLVLVRSYSNLAVRNDDLRVEEVEVRSAHSVHQKPCLHSQLARGMTLKI